MYLFTPEAKALLKRLEGCKLVAYLDQKNGDGVWTVGFGHTGADVTPVTVWSQEKADLTLDRDLARFIQGVRQIVAKAPPLTNVQFSVLVLFAYNVGLVALERSTLMANIEEGLFDAVPDQLRRWNKVHASSGVYVIDPKLVVRRNEEIKLWLAGTPAA